MIKEELDYELLIKLDPTNKVDRFACQTIKGIAEVISRGNYFAQDKGGQLYYYKNGLYRVGAERAIVFAVRQIIDCFADMDWRSSKSREVFEYIKVGSEPLLDRPELHRINLLNGIYNTQTKELEPHDPSYRTTVQLNVHYDTNAKCPEWEKFIKATFPIDEESQKLGYEIPAWLMVPYTESQKSVVLLGSGSNGKSIYLNGIEEFLGRENICNISLQKLADRFTTTLLIGKLANISPDLPNTKITSTGEFKALTGGDGLAGEYKHGTMFRFFPFARCLFACNELPDTPDASDGFYRRLNIIEFGKKFKDDPNEGRRLKLALTSQKELAGLFNKALDILPVVLAQGITVTESMRTAADDHRKENDPVAQWLDEYTTGDLLDDLEAWIDKKELFREYKQSGNVGKASKNNVAFGKAIKRYRPEVFPSQKRVEGGIINTYVGIRLKTDLENADLMADDDTHMKPTEEEVELVIAKYASDDEFEMGE